MANGLTYARKTASTKATKQLAETLAPYLHPGDVVVLYIAMIELGFDNTLSIWVGSLFICFFRMWCYYRSWRIAYHDEFIHEDPSPETDRDRRQQ